MKQILGLGIIILGTASISACNSTGHSNSGFFSSNALTKEFKGPYGGVPAFDKMDLALLEPALEYGMNQANKDYNEITSNTDTPTFENTIVEMEKAGEALSTTLKYWVIWRSNLSSPEFRSIQSKMAPKLSAHRTQILQNKALFKRVEAVYNSEQFSNLNQEQQRITTMLYQRFVRNGARLNQLDQKRFAEINQRLAQLHTQFSNNVLADEENYVLFISADQLDGLPESFIRSASALAKSKGYPDKFAISNTRSSMDPFLTYSSDRDLRQRVWETYYSRGNNNDEFDNKDIIQEILSLRHERVRLLGYDNYAQWRLEDRMAKTPQRAMNLLMKVWPSALERVEQEVADMQVLANQEQSKINIAPWDYRYYAEKVRQKHYNLDSDEIKEYLQLDKLREAMFFVAEQLFKFEFSEVPAGKVPVFHEDVRVWEVSNIETGKFIGLWYLDPFARQGKRSGAWATTYRAYTRFQGETTVLASNNSNFVKAPEGEATLISWSDAETFFHEFGHALHYLSANVDYPSSHNGVRDYTEFQSQLLERWLLTDEVIQRFLVHHETGATIPSELVKKIKAAATFNEGFKTTEYLASAIMDLLYHTTDPALIDVANFERQELSKLSMPSELVMRHRSTHFSHVFSSEGYAAAYYGYIWAEVLTADAIEAFAAAPGGFYDKELSERMVKYLFEVRNAMDPAEAYRKFRGRDAKEEALMKARGFVNE